MQQQRAITKHFIIRKHELYKLSKITLIYS